MSEAHTSAACPILGRDELHLALRYVGGIDEPTWAPAKNLCSQVYGEPVLCAQGLRKWFAVPASATELWVRRSVRPRAGALRVRQAPNCLQYERDGRWVSTQTAIYWCFAQWLDGRAWWVTVEYADAE